MTQTFAARRAARQEPDDAALALKFWMVRTGTSLKELADALECSISQVSRWRKRLSKPSRSHASQLEQITEGAVPVPLWDKTKKESS